MNSRKVQDDENVHDEYSESSEENEVFGQKLDRFEKEYDFKSLFTETRKSDCAEPERHASHNNTKKVLYYDEKEAYRRTEEFCEATGTTPTIIVFRFHKMKPMPQKTHSTENSNSASHKKHKSTRATTSTNNSSSSYYAPEVDYYSCVESTCEHAQTFARTQLNEILFFITQYVINICKQVQTHKINFSSEKSKQTYLNLVLAFSQSTREIIRRLSVTNFADSITKRIIIQQLDEMDKRSKEEKINDLLNPVRNAGKKNSKVCFMTNIKLEDIECVEINDGGATEMLTYASRKMCIGSTTCTLDMNMTTIHDDDWICPCGIISPLWEHTRDRHDEQAYIKQRTWMYSNGCIHRRLVNLKLIDTRTYQNMMHLRTCDRCVTLNAPNAYCAQHVKTCVKQELDSSFFYHPKYEYPLSIFYNSPELNTDNVEKQKDEDIQESFFLFDCPSFSQFVYNDRVYKQDLRHSSKTLKQHVKHNLNNNNKKSSLEHKEDESNNNNSNNSKVHIIHSEIHRLLNVNLLHASETCCAIPFYVPRECNFEFLMRAAQELFCTLHPEQADDFSYYSIQAWLREKKVTQSLHRFPVCQLEWNDYETLDDFVDSTQNYDYPLNETFLSRELAVHRSTEIRYQCELLYIKHGIVFDFDLIPRFDNIIPQYYSSSVNLSSSNNVERKMFKLDPRTLQTIQTLHLSVDAENFNIRAHFSQISNSKSVKDGKENTRKEENIVNKLNDDNVQNEKNLYLLGKLIDIEKDVVWKNSVRDVEKCLCEVQHFQGMFSILFGQAEFSFLTFNYLRMDAVHHIIELDTVRRVALWQVTQDILLCILYCIEEYKQEISIRTLPLLLGAIFLQLIRHNDKSVHADDNMSLYCLPSSKIRLLWWICVNYVFYDLSMWLRSYTSYKAEKDIHKLYLEDKKQKTEQKRIKKQKVENQRKKRAAAHAALKVKKQQEEKQRQYQKTQKQEQEIKKKETESQENIECSNEMEENVNSNIEYNDDDNNNDNDNDIQITSKRRSISSRKEESIDEKNENINTFRMSIFAMPLFTFDKLLVEKNRLQYQNNNNNTTNTELRKRITPTDTNEIHAHSFNPMFYSNFSLAESIKNMITK